MSTTGQIPFTLPVIKFKDKLPIFELLGMTKKNRHHSVETWCPFCIARLGTNITQNATVEFNSLY